MKHFFIGSLPFSDPNQAMRFVGERSAHLPFLPQLPSANPQEDMIGQVLRGLEIGGWDEKASCCFKPFLTRYAASQEIKIQIAGPLTVARSMSITSEECEPAWVSLVEGILVQISDFGFRGDLWLQIDEPFWSRAKPLFKTYDAMLAGLKSKGRLRLGLHSCASNRPEQMPANIDFWSFDYSMTAMNSKEREYWSGRRATLIAGICSKKNPPKFDYSVPTNWISAGCGLYDWSMEEIEQMLNFTNPG